MGCILAVKTVIEWNPRCGQAAEYRKLAMAIHDTRMFVVPKPLKIPELESLLMEYGLLRHARFNNVARQTVPQRMRCALVEENPHALAG